MRPIIKISLLFCFAVSANFAFAEQYSQFQLNQEGEKRQITEGIDPAGGLVGGTEPIEDSAPTYNDTDDEQQATEQQSVDSTEDTSVSKHNFIFYFLYKLKYNENQEVQEIF